jgi:perosamine synthetase
MAEQEFIPITKPFMGEAEAQAAARPIMRGWVTQGPEVAALEKEFAAYTGAKYACAVSSGTTALHLALLAVGVQPGDEVITVSHSFIATANSIRYCGAVPVFVDIDRRTFNMDPAHIADAITPKTRAILCVHQVGMPCNMAAIAATAREHGLHVVEDAACAAGSEILVDGDWQKIGRVHGDVVCFSFHPRKVISTGDGGMLTTNHPEWDALFRLWRHHGMSVSDTVRHKANDVIFEDYVALGYNYRMTDIQAAVGREQLKRLPELVHLRRELAARYHERLAAIPSITLPHEPEWVRSNWQSYCIYLPEDRDQRGVMQLMLDRGVATRRAVMCAHREPAYEKEPWRCAERPACGCEPRTCRRLANSEYAQDHAIVIPLFAQMTEAQQDRVCSALQETLKNDLTRARSS